MILPEEKYELDGKEILLRSANENADDANMLIDYLGIEKINAFIRKIGCPDTNADEVHAMNDAGGYFALYCGHDHKNSFVAHVHDLDLGYSPTCGFGCYGPKSRLRATNLLRI